ncbi:MAG TPA: PAS domain S-box protein, partial [Magnetovibrio sp.]
MLGKVGKSTKATKAAKPGDGPSCAWARELFDHLQCDLAVYLEGGRIRDISTAGAQLLGFDDPKPLIGRFFADFVDRDQLIIALQVLSGKATPGEEVRVRIIPETGQSFDVAMASTPLSDEGNHIALRARAVRTEAEKQTDSFISTDLYRYLFETSQAMICVLDSEGYMLLVNESAWRTLKHENSLGLVGRPFLHIVHPDYQEAMDAGLDIFAAETEPLPLKFMRADGEFIDVEVNFSPLGDGQFMLEALDITERTRAADTLQDREQRLRGVLETVADAIITINDHGEVLSFNKAAEKTFGYAAREVTGRNVSMLIAEPHASKHDEYLANYVRTGQKKIIGKTNREEFGVRKDGTVFPLEFAVTELRQGSKRFFTGIIRDITDRKRWEAEIKSAHDELEMRVEERTRELTQEIVERQRAEDKLLLAGE